LRNEFGASWAYGNYKRDERRQARKGRGRRMGWQKVPQKETQPVRRLGVEERDRTEWACGVWLKAVPGKDRSVARSEGLRWTCSGAAAWRRRVGR
jgi:hypothetical protein